MNKTECLKNMKILYVEDDAEAREELTDVLKRRAGKVAVAENGKEGLELCREFEPDIILADLYMPEMGGIEMIREIRENNIEAKVIVISAVGETDIILEAIDVGIDKYILKPVVLKDLLPILDEQAQEIQSSRNEAIAPNLENKKQLENDIKSAIATFLKSHTGKGPRDVNVFISDNQIEVVAVDVLTTYEKSVLDNVQNIVIIKNIREAFFSAKEKDVCNRISSVIEKDVRLQDVFINVEKDRNKLVFTII